MENFYFLICILFFSNLWVRMTCKRSHLIFLNLKRSWILTLAIAYLTLDCDFSWFFFVQTNTRIGCCNLKWKSEMKTNLFPYLWSLEATYSYIADITVSWVQPIIAVWFSVIVIYHNQNRKKKNLKNFKS